MNEWNYELSEVTTELRSTVGKRSSISFVVNVWKRITSNSSLVKVENSTDVVLCCEEQMGSESENTAAITHNTAARDERQKQKQKQKKTKKKGGSELRFSAERVVESIVLDSTLTASLSTSATFMSSE